MVVDPVEPRGLIVGDGRRLGLRRLLNTQQPDAEKFGDAPGLRAAAARLRPECPGWGWAAAVCPERSRRNSALPGPHTLHPSSLGRLGLFQRGVPVLGHRVS